MGTVRDEGIGIDPGETDGVFDVFQRLHSREEYAGMGIGLALCERIVERHGGDIWVGSEPGKEYVYGFAAGRRQSGVAYDAIVSFRPSSIQEGGETGSGRRRP